jgi:hypothetical protein
MAILKIPTTMFLRELDRRGIPAPKPLDPGRFLVRVNDWTCT